MSDERRDYAILVSLYMREEAEVMASALRAEGIDAFLGNWRHATFDWGYTIALGGLQVMVPRQKLQEAKDVIRARIEEAAENPEGEPVGWRDRYKIWLVILGWIGLVASGNWVNAVLPEQYQREIERFRGPWSADEPETPEIISPPTPVHFAAPDHLTEAEQREVLLDHCKDYPWDSVISREDGVGYVTPCADVLPVDQAR